MLIIVVVVGTGDSLFCFFSTLLLFIAKVCFDVSSSSLMEKICGRSLSTLIIKDVNNRFLLLELSYDMKRVFWARVMRFCRAANCTPSLSLKYIFNAMSYLLLELCWRFLLGVFVVPPRSGVLTPQLVARIFIHCSYS